MTAVRLEDPRFLEQKPDDLPSFSDLQARLEAGGVRVVDQALRARGSAAPDLLFREAAFAVLRAMPPLLGPGNASLRRERTLEELARGLGLAASSQEEFLLGLSFNDILPPSIRQGTYEMIWDDEPPWREHLLALEVAGEQLRGVVVVDRGTGPVARVPSPDEGAHVLRFVPEPAGDPCAPLRFAVDAGVLRPTRHEFELEWSPVAQRTEPSPAWDLLGSVRINGEARAARARWRPSTPGVSPPWPRLPSWGQLATAP